MKQTILNIIIIILFKVYLNRHLSKCCVPWSPPLKSSKKNNQSTLVSFWLVTVTAALLSFAQKLNSILLSRNFLGCLQYLTHHLALFYFPLLYSSLFFVLVICVYLLLLFVSCVKLC